MRRFNVLYLLSAMVIFVSGTGMAAQEIITKFSQQQQADFYGKIEMIVYKPGKEEQIYTFESWLKGKDLALIRYLSPPRERGNGVLRIKNDIYMYLARVNRTMRISGRQPLAGGDFTNADILGIDLAGDYEATLEGIERIDMTDYYVLSLQARTRGSVYPKIKIWLRRSDLRPLKQEYYTMSDILLRTLHYDEFEIINDQVMVKKMTMTNTLAPGEYTVINILEGKHGENIPDSFFTVTQLERGF